MGHVCWGRFFENKSLKMGHWEFWIDWILLDWQIHMAWSFSNDFTSFVRCWSAFRLFLYFKTWLDWVLFYWWNIICIKYNTTNNLKSKHYPLWCYDYNSKYLRWSNPIWKCQFRPWAPSKIWIKSPNKRTILSER